MLKVIIPKITDSVLFTSWKGKIINTAPIAANIEKAVIKDCSASLRLGRPGPKTPPP